jgi:hypothetical protein
MEPQIVNSTFFRKAFRDFRHFCDKTNSRDVSGKFDDVTGGGKINKKFLKIKTEIIKT